MDARPHAASRRLLCSATTKYCEPGLLVCALRWCQWRRSGAFRWHAGGHKRTFDLHRSGAMWVYPLVLMLAITSVAMNLPTQVMRPVVSWFSTLSPSPFDSHVPVPPQQAVEPQINATQAIALAQQAARQRGITAPAAGLLLSTEYGVWGVGFFNAHNSHGDGGLGNPWLYVDARTGAATGAHVPGTGSTGDLFLQSRFPPHSGRILGITGPDGGAIYGAPRHAELRLEHKL